MWEGGGRRSICCKQHDEDDHCDQKQHDKDDHRDHDHGGGDVNDGEEDSLVYCQLV